MTTLGPRTGEPHPAGRPLAARPLPRRRPSAGLSRPARYSPPCADRQGGRAWLSQLTDEAAASEQILTRKLVEQRIEDIVKGPEPTLTTWPASPPGWPAGLAPRLPPRPVNDRPTTMRHVRGWSPGLWTGCEGLPDRAPRQGLHSPDRAAAATSHRRRGPHVTAARRGRGGRRRPRRRRRRHRRGDVRAALRGGHRAGAQLSRRSWLAHRLRGVTVRAVCAVRVLSSARRSPLARHRQGA